MQKRLFKTICFKRKFEHASYILHSFEIDTVFDLYFGQIFKETFCQLRGKTPLETFNLESLNNRRVTRASVAKILPSMKTRTQIMQRSWKNVSLKCYNFLKSNELIPDNLNQLTEHQLNEYFKKLFSLFLKDNGDLLRFIFFESLSRILSRNFCHRFFQGHASISCIAFCMILGGFDLYMRFIVYLSV